MSLNQDALTPEKIKELLADPNSWLSKQANTEMAELDYLTTVKNIIAVEMANTAMKALELQDNEAKARVQKSENERERFNEQMEIYNNGYNQLHAMAFNLANSSTKDPSNILKLLEEISKKITAQIQNICVEQQASFAKQVVNRLNVTFPDGQTYEASQSAKEKITEVLEAPISMQEIENPSLTIAIAEARLRHHEEYLNKNAKTPHNPTFDEVIAARLDTSKRFNDAEKLARKRVEVVANTMRQDYHDQIAQRNDTDIPSLSPQNDRCFNQHAHRVMIIDLKLVDNFERMLALLIIGSELKNSIAAGLSQDPEKISTLLARNGLAIDNHAHRANNRMS